MIKSRATVCSWHSTTISSNRQCLLQREEIHVVLLQKVVCARKVVPKDENITSLYIYIFILKEKPRYKGTGLPKAQRLFKPEVRPEKRFQNQGPYLPLNHPLFLSDLQSL